MLEFFEFVTRDNKIKRGYLVHAYSSFEGGIRYIFRCEEDGKDYRCVKSKNGKFIEFVI